MPLSPTPFPTRLAAGLALGAVAAGVAGATMLAGRRDARQTAWPTPPGDLIDVTDASLHVVDTGSSRRGTVLFESALASPCTEWSRVAEVLGDDVRSIAYDRVGNGWTGAGGRAGAAIDAAATADRAAALLDRLGVTEPVVLVGHSVGGLLVRAFAGRHPERVAGLVLVDSSHPDQLERSSAQRDSAPLTAHGIRLMRSRARRGEVQPDDGFGAIHALPPHIADVTARLLCRPEPWSGALAEAHAWHPGWTTAARDAALRPDLPVAVVTAGEQVRSDRVHGVLQDELAALTTDTWHRTAPHLGHDAVAMEPAGAAIVAEAIGWTLDRAAARHPEVTA